MTDFSLSLLTENDANAKAQTNELQSWGSSSATGTTLRQTAAYNIKCINVETPHLATES
jgi:hypothetical protein